MNKSISLLVAIIGGCDPSGVGLVADAAIDASGGSIAADLGADALARDRAVSRIPDAGRDLSWSAVSLRVDRGAAVQDATAGLVLCATPGKPCDAHDPCALSPICGGDLICRPAGYQDCDDQLPCTVDQCAGAGACSHTPRAGTCLLDVGGELRCFAEGDAHPQAPCLACRAAADQRRWSPVSGPAACDDGDPCTKQDACVAGVCQGTYYGMLCQDMFSCTDDLCNGTGGCAGNPLRSDACLIAGTCYVAGDHNSDDSGVCDPAQSQIRWTAL